MAKPNLTDVVERLRSPQARPLLREAGWAAGVSVVLILVSSLVLPGVAYAVYLAVAIFFAATLTGVFTSLLEAETEERLLSSPTLRLWLAGFAGLVALLAAAILV